MKFWMVLDLMQSSQGFIIIIRWYLNFTSGRQHHFKRQKWHVQVFMELQEKLHSQCLVCQCAMNLYIIKRGTGYMCTYTPLNNIISSLLEFSLWVSLCFSLFNSQNCSACPCIIHWHCLFTIINSFWAN